MTGASEHARDVLRRGRRQARREVRERVERLELRAWRVAACALGAGLAWWLASTVLGHEGAFLAPIAAMIGIGTAEGRKLRRTAEIVGGVAVGVLVGDLMVWLVGSGTWQIVVAVAAAMAVALLVDAGPLVTTQAGVNAVIVTTLLPDTSAGLSRWLDAVVGGLVALLAVALSPLAPYRAGREIAAELLHDCATAVRQAAQALEDDDGDLADEALTTLRGTQPQLDELTAFLGEAAEVVRLSPLRSRRRSAATRYATLVEPLDRAVRNLRVLARRVVIALQDDERLTTAQPQLLRDLADAVELLADELATGQAPERARAALEAVARASAHPRQLGSYLSAQVVLAQVRSAVVDLLQVTGLDLVSAVEAVPRTPVAGS